MITELLEHKRIVEDIASYGMWSDAPGIELFGEMLCRMDFVPEAMSFVHVAGTNGKGSSVFYTQEILAKMGYRVGTYTSPHLDDPCERICINGKEIEFAIFDSIAKEVLKLVDEPPEFMPTSSDIYLAVALLYFQKEKCDYVILEAGLGGRLDSTTAVFDIKPADVSLITRIDYDHTAILGNTLEKIASEKAHIIKNGSKVVIAKMPDEAKRCIIDRCKQIGVNYKSVEEDLTVENLVKDFFSKLLVGYQRENITNAIYVVKELGFATDQIIKTFDAVSQKGPKGRLYELPEKAGRPRILIDGAHNPSGIKALCNYMKNKNISGAIGVCAIMRDKDSKKMIDDIAPFMSEVYLTSVGEGERRTDTTVLDERFQNHNTKVHLSADIKQAVSDAIDVAFTAKVPVVVFGSLELAMEAVKIIEEY